jgi:undecaprenyl-diphosphatase
MDWLQVTILSIIEGLTEFLPISSTGHLILASKLLGIAENEFVKTFEVAIQAGAILAIVVLYFNKLVKNTNLIKKLIVAFIPTAIVGFVFYPFIKGFLLGSSSVTLWALFLGGIVLILLEKVLPKKSSKSIELEDISYQKSFLIGVFQSISIIPGVSRAAATIIGGLFSGLSRTQAVEFSFLLAVPTMFAATSYDLYKSASLFNQQNFLTLGVGFVLSFIFALVAVKFLINFVKKNDFTLFGVYRIALAILFWLFIN